MATSERRLTLCMRYLITGCECGSCSQQIAFAMGCNFRHLLRQAAIPLFLILVKVKDHVMLSLLSLGDVLQNSVRSSLER